eukprot:5006522-Prymnesium_polylepis.1
MLNFRKKFHWARVLSQRIHSLKGTSLQAELASAMFRSGSPVVDLRTWDAPSRAAGTRQAPRRCCCRSCRNR